MKQKIWQLFQCTPVRISYEKKVFVAAVQYSRSKKFILKVVKNFSPNFKRGNLELWCLRFTTDVCRISILFRFGSLYQKYHPKKQSTQLGTCIHFLGKIFSTKRCNAFFVKRRSMWITWNLNKGANSSSWSILKLIKMQKGNVARKSSKLRDFYCFLSSKSLTKSNFKKFKEIHQIFNSLMYWPKSIEESNTSFFLKSLDLSTTMVIVLKAI